MPDILVYADTIRSPALRHEVPVAIPDPFLYVEQAGARHVVVTSLEFPRLEGLGLELHALEEFGVDELRRSGRLGTQEINDEIALRAVRELGVQSAVVPADFPLLLADRLRAANVEIAPERALFDRRRRVKRGAELTGIRRAQAAAEAGMSAARDLLRRARRNGSDVLHVDGAPLTSERIKGAIAQAFLAHGASAAVFVVSHGAQAAVAHDFGAGPIREGETVVIDLWPRDNESACSADMTRTFVVGDVSPEAAEWQRLCKEALDRAFAEARAGVAGRQVYDVTCDIFEAAGYPTQRTKEAGQTLADGFFHSLGHGVGLEVHEQPNIGIAGHDPLVAGDVIALEPGLYRSGVGGCRLEDLVLVTDDGAENLTSFPYDLQP